MNASNALVPAGNGRARGMVLRVILTIAAVLVYGWVNFLLNPVATMLAAGQAGKQFENNEVSAVASIYGMNFLGHLGIPFLVLLLVLACIWWGIARRLLAMLAAVGALLPSPASAYYDKTDFTEAYTILPNESGFWIPDAGANKDSQGSLNPRPT